MGDWLNALVIPRDNIPGLWDQFLTEFREQFQDTQAVQRARNELRDCKMKGSDYDDYIMRFKALARKANYVIGNEETYNMFLQGLPEQLLHNTLKPPIPPQLQQGQRQSKIDHPRMSGN